MTVQLMEKTADGLLELLSVTMVGDLMGLKKERLVAWTEFVLDRWLD